MWCRQCVASVCCRPNLARYRVATAEAHRLKLISARSGDDAGIGIAEVAAWRANRWICLHLRIHGGWE